MNRIPQPRRLVPCPPKPGQLYEDYRIGRLDVDNHNLRIDIEDAQQTIRRQKKAILVLAAVALSLAVALASVLLTGRWLA